LVTAIGSTEGADEKFPVWDILRRIPHRSEPQPNNSKDPSKI
jgi:hypothetical protein